MKNNESWDSWEDGEDANTFKGASARFVQKRMLKGPERKRGEADQNAPRNLQNSDKHDPYAFDVGEQESLVASTKVKATKSKVIIVKPAAPMSKPILAAPPMIRPSGPKHAAGLSALTATSSGVDRCFKALEVTLGVPPTESSPTSGRASFKNAAGKAVVITDEMRRKSAAAFGEGSNGHSSSQITPPGERKSFLCAPVSGPNHASANTKYASSQHANRAGGKSMLRPKSKTKPETNTKPDTNTKTKTATKTNTKTKTKTKSAHQQDSYDSDAEESLPAEDEEDEDEDEDEDEENGQAERGPKRGPSLAKLTATSARKQEQERVNKARQANALKRELERDLYRTSRKRQAEADVAARKRQRAEDKRHRDELELLRRPAIDEERERMLQDMDDDFWIEQNKGSNCTLFNRSCLNLSHSHTL